MKIESNYPGLISSERATGETRSKAVAGFVDSPFAQELSSEISQTKLDEMERASSLLSDQIVKMRARFCLFTQSA